VLRTEIEIERFIEYGVIMVAAKVDLAPLDHKIETLTRTCPIPDDVTQTENLLDAPPINVSQHRLERFQVAVNVGNHGEHRRKNSQFRARGRGW
jgi:hypothetical protein